MIKKTFYISGLVLFGLVSGWFIHEIEEEWEPFKSPKPEFEGRLVDPDACAVSSAGQLFVLEADYSVIQAFNQQNQFLFSFGGNHPRKEVPGLFTSKEELVFQPDGTLVVLDGPRLQTFNKNGHFLDVVVEKENSPLDHPEEIAVDEDGRIYVTCEDIQEIVQFSPDFSSYKTFSVPNEPEGIAPAPDGRIWVSFSKADYIGVYDQEGNRKHRIGKTGDQKGEFNIPDAMIISSDYDVYVADQGNHRIQVLDRNGNVQRMFGEPGSGPAQFRDPEDLQIGPDGNLYVAGSDNGRIQILRPDGTYVRELN